MNEWMSLKEKPILSLASTSTLLPTAVLGVKCREGESIDNNCAKTGARAECHSKQTGNPSEGEKGEAGVVVIRAGK